MYLFLKCTAVQFRLDSSPKIQPDRSLFSMTNNPKGDTIRWSISHEPRDVGRMIFRKWWKCGAEAAPHPDSTRRNQRRNSRIAEAIPLATSAIPLTRATQARGLTAQ